MRKVIFGFLCFIFAIESINIIFMSNKLGISGTIFMLIMTLGMSYYFYRLATKNNNKNNAHKDMHRGAAMHTETGYCLYE